MPYSWQGSQKRLFCSILCNTAELERTILYKTRIVEMVHYQDETNWHGLKNKGLYLVSDIELFSCVHLCTLSESCRTSVSVGFGKAYKISIEGYCIGARNTQTLRKVLSEK